jgi:hypothetical protein
MIRLSDLFGHHTIDFMVGNQHIVSSERQTGLLLGASDCGGSIDMAYAKSHHKMLLDKQAQNSA